MESQQQQLAALRSALIGTVGILYIGVPCSAALYGITCAQTLTYFRSGVKDRWQLKSIVYFLWVLDTLHQALVIHALWFYLIAQYANPAALELLIWSIPAAWLINTIISIAVDFFLLWRLWIVSRNKYYSALCGLGLLVQTAFNLANNIKSFLIGDVEAADASLKTFATAAISTESAMSLLLSGGLVYYLLKKRSSFRKTSDMIRKLVIIAISTGLVASVFCWAEIISYFIAPTKLYQMFFNFLIGKLYINALLTSLNYRNTLHEKSDKEASTLPIELSQASSDPSTHRTISANRPKTNSLYEISNWREDDQPQGGSKLLV